jgi:predicted RNase H-like HicB family nuclease
MAEFSVIIEKDEEGWYVASVPEIPGCYTQGKTIQQVLERIKEAMVVCLKADGGDVKPMKFIGIQRVEM